MTAASWRRVNAALAIVLALLVILALLVVWRGNKVLPWTTAAERHTQRYDAVERAASRAVIAFLDVDYRAMDAKIKRVESLSTGQFKTQYSGSSVEFKAAAQQAQAVSAGTVRYVAVNSVTEREAKVLVAANTVVKNSSTGKTKATKACPHAGARCDKYRFVVTLDKTGAGWKMSNLAGVS